MGLTVLPEDDGTVTVVREGSELVYTRDMVLASDAFTRGEERFLLSMFRYAVPGPVACAVPDYPPDE